MNETGKAHTGVAQIGLVAPRLVGDILRLLVRVLESGVGLDVALGILGALGHGD